MKPLPRYRPDTDPRKVDRIVGTTDNEPTTNTIGRRSPAGDEHRLRALPVSVKGVAGVIPGTNPHAALEAKERAAKRFIHRRINRA